MKDPKQKLLERLVRLKRRRVIVDWQGVFAYSKGMNTFEKRTFFMEIDDRREELSVSSA